MCGDRGEMYLAAEELGEEALTRFVGMTGTTLIARHACHNLLDVHPAAGPGDLPALAALLSMAHGDGR